MFFKGQNFSFVLSSPPDTLWIFFILSQTFFVYIPHFVNFFLLLHLTALLFHTIALDKASKIWKESDIYTDNVPAGLANVWKRPHALGTNFCLIGVKHLNNWGYCWIEAFFPLWYLVLVIIRQIVGLCGLILG